MGDTPIRRGSPTSRLSRRLADDSGVGEPRGGVWTRDNPARIRQPPRLIRGWASNRTSIRSAAELNADRPDRGYLTARERVQNSALAGNVTGRGPINGMMVLSIADRWSAAGMTAARDLTGPR